MTLSPNQLEAAWRHWVMSPEFRTEAGKLAIRRPEATGLADLLSELIDWKLADMSGAPPARNEIDEAGRAFLAGPKLWREYMREDIPPLFGTVFNPGNWNSGIVTLSQDMVLLNTLQKGSMSVRSHYEDRFLSPTRMQWQSQTRQESRHGQILSGQIPGHRVHLFVRSEKLRGKTAAPLPLSGGATLCRMAG